MIAIIHLICIIIVSILIIIVIFLGTHLVKMEYFKIQIEVPAKFRYIHISDIHDKISFINGSISNMINSHSPNFVVATGDYSNTQDNLSKVIMELGNIKSPVFMVLGNYEREEQINFLKKRQTPLDLLEKEVSKYSNLKLLINEGSVLNIESTKIFIYGFDNSTYGNEIYNSVNNINSQYKIILAHSPNIINIIEKEKIEYNHILVGHTHGKQINIPIVTKTVYDKFHIGFKKMSRNRFFSISKGLGTVRIPIRINSRPVISIYDVLKN